MENKNINIKRLIKIYIWVYGITMLLFCAIKGPLWWGEYDDYTLPVASILNDFNFSINDTDITKYKEIFPELTSIDEHLSLSGYTTKNGDGELTWYFPTYAIVCLPMVVILLFLGLPASYGFILTNIIFIITLLLYAYKSLKFNDLKKFATIILLSINPILFYLPWMMAEVCIFSFIGMAMISWHNGWNKRAAVFISLAGTLNPTIMIVGIVMIIDFLIRVLKSKQKEESFLAFILSRAKTVIGYGSCYVIGLIPMIYNLYHVGHINLTASYDSFTQGRETTLARFCAHFFDLNFGFLPYYGILLVLACLLLIGAVINKYWRYLEMLIAFVLNVLLYSAMVHINCGGSGMARYGSWCAIIMVLAVAFYFDEIYSGKILKNISKVLVFANTCILVLIIYFYGPYATSNTWGESWSPIAKFVLNNAPVLYNPLGSTFYANVNGILGGYDYVTPVIYTDDEGYVRKILATSKDADLLKNEYEILSGDETWFYGKLEDLSENESYISVPNKYKIAKCNLYTLGEKICFSQEGYNANSWVASGMSWAESWGSWTDDKEVILRMKINTAAEKIHGTITAGVFNEQQQVVIYVNDTLVYHDVYYGNKLEFIFDSDASGIYEVRIQLPDAQEGIPSDGRVLGLSIGHILFYVEEEVYNSYTLGEDICFAQEGYNADNWVASGISWAESWGSWTDSQQLVLRMQLQDEVEDICGNIIAGVFDKQQRVMIYVNGEVVYADTYYGTEEGICFEFKNPSTGKCEIVIELPDSKEGVPSDGRKLGLSIGHIVFSGR